MENDFKPFDLVDEDLIGNNTIEASAGTGKTYSIAVLVVRLILEKKLPIEKILLVTFTEAAAAELKERTVKFIRLALLETKEKNSSKDKTIAQIVENCTNIDSAEKQSLLNQALLDIDKATMSTIHSFCQETLNEFAFETGQEFGKELMKEVSEIVEQELNEYWRKNIATGDKKFFKYLKIDDKEVWKKAIENALKGQELVGQIKNNSFLEVNTKVEFENIKAKALNKFPEDITCYKNTLTDELISEFDKNIQKYIDRVENHTKKTRKGWRDYLNDGRAFHAYLSKSKVGFNFDEIFANEKSKMEAIKAEISRIKEEKEKVENDFTEKEKEIAHYHLNKAIKSVLPEIRVQLTKRNAFTFDDLIQSLYKKRGEKQLQVLMREEYKAVFVDEFQDTDPYQYAIFKSLFQDNEETVLFYIGDPKQSIYGWRKADLETYRSARDSKGMKRLNMNKNYRSSTKFIEAANYFFKLNEDSKLDYRDVIAVNNKQPGLAWSDPSKGGFSSIFVRNNHSKKKDIKQSIKKELHLLFSGKVKLNGLSVQPSNVAVLVRMSKEGKEIKGILDQLNVPSVVLAEESIFSSAEALELKVLLNAVLNISQNNIAVLLLTDLMGKKPEELHKINFDSILPFFYELKSVWEEEGVFVMLTRFMNEFDLISKWSKESVTGQQKLSNLQQLKDILQNESLRSSLTPSEQLAYLSHQIKEKPKDDEYEQRIESDEAAVQIMTLHKSKGLEFDIVLLPYLSMEAKEEYWYTFSSFRKKEEGVEHNTYYFSLNGLQGENKELFKQQLQEENERLLYVGVTRAKYNALVFAKKGKTHLLSPYVKALMDNPNGLIKVEDYDEREDWSSLAVELNNESRVESSPKFFPKADFPDKNYHKMSYSFLAGTAAKSVKLNEDQLDPGTYDEFIFKDLAKGAHIGNLLHDIFEFIDFTDKTDWEAQIERSVQHLLPSKSKEEHKGYRNLLYQMVEHTVNASIEIGGETLRLSEIPRTKRINELEFNFPIKEEFSSLSLEYLLGEEDNREILTTRSSVRGMMTGFVDLFFEHKGKYYILDWKSNFLGDNLSYYDAEGVLKGMNEGNYHLQYLLYTLAVEKFLKNRLGENFDFEKHFGGIVYVFLRGTRSGKSSGLYVKDVKKEELEKLKGIV